MSVTDSVAITAIAMFSGQRRRFVLVFVFFIAADCKALRAYELPNCRPVPQGRRNMAARKKTPKASGNADAGSNSATSSAQSSARATVSGPTRKGGAAAITDAATAKIAGA